MKRVLPTVREDRAEERGIGSMFANRTRLSIVLLSLAGLPLGIASCINQSLDPLEDARKGAIEAGNERHTIKNFYVGQARAYIILGEVKNEKGSRIRGSIELHADSPLNDPLRTANDYDLPSEAAPWTKMRVSSEGLITLEGGPIELTFVCNAGTGVRTCSGVESSELPKGAPSNPVNGGFVGVADGGNVSPDLQLAQEMLIMTNLQRAIGRKCGETLFPPAPPLVMIPLLNTTASNHAADMARRNFLNPVNLEGKDPSKRMKEAGYASSNYGENIAEGQTSATAVADRWIRSPGHCVNIMNPEFKGFGFGHSINFHGEHYWVQDFAGSVSNVVTPNAQTVADAGAPDAQVQPDSGSLPEIGAVGDAWPTIDAGTTADAGSTDGGNAGDTEGADATTDAAVTDGGTGADASIPPSLDTSMTTINNMDSSQLHKLLKILSPKQPGTNSSDQFIKERIKRLALTGKITPDQLAKAIAKAM